MLRELAFRLFGLAYLPESAERPILCESIRLKEPPQVHFDHPRENDYVPTELKFATYREGLGYVRVAYAIFYGNRCVMSAASKGTTSTINRSEDLAEVIVRREQRPLSSLRFYDLQTHTGYVGCYKDYFSEITGRFDFNEIVLGYTDYGSLTTKSWNSVDCPPEVISLFRQYIGESPRQTVHRAFDSEF